MKLFELKCKNCGSKLKVNEGSTDIVCQFCGANFKFDDEVIHHKIDDAEKTGYEIEKGRIKAQKEYEEEKKIENNSKKKRIRKRIGYAILLVSVILVLVILFSFFKYLHVFTSTSKRGESRFDTKENNSLSDTLLDDIKSVYSNQKSIGSSSVNVEGRIIYISIDFCESIDVAKAKALAVKSLEKLGEENLKSYEVQFILTYSGKTENTNFPIFGSKGLNRTDVVW